MTVNKLTSPISQNDLINKTNEIIDNLGGGSSTDVQINGTSITSGGVANILTQTAYNASSNKIATMSDLPTGGANTDLSNLTATGEAHFLKNRSTGVNSISIGNGNSASGAINIGDLSTCGEYSIAIGGYNNGYCSIMLGNGYSSNVNYSFDVGVNDYNSYDRIGRVTYQMLDLKTGLIPDARISTNIQRTSTAVTHTASTQVGSSTKPIYISSTGEATASTSTIGGSSTPVYMNNGTITSTGLSIASSRFDGQWIPKWVRVFNSTAIQNTSYDLSNYLPSDYTSEAYEIYGSLYLSSDVTTQLTVGRVSSPYVDVSSGTRTDDNFGASAGTHSNCRRAFRSFMLVMGYCYSSHSSTTKSLHRYLYCQVTGTKASSYAVVELLGYRRIGTNT